MIKVQVSDNDLFDIPGSQAVPLQSFLQGNEGGHGEFRICKMFSLGPGIDEGDRVRALKIPNIARAWDFTADIPAVSPLGLVPCSRTQCNWPDHISQPEYLKKSAQECNFRSTSTKPSIRKVVTYCPVEFINVLKRYFIMIFSLSVSDYSSRLGKAT